MYTIPSKLFTLLPIKNKTNNNKHVICSMQLQKELKSNPKQSSCKQCVAPKNAVVKKDVKSIGKVVAKKWL